MNMLVFRIIMAAVMLAGALPAQSQRADETNLRYISAFSSLAVEQQQKYGIPASITLAQGLLESSAGRSTLATEGNNHFGIKCHASWTGETMLRDDDSPDECFRVYGTAAESYRDHSRFLRGKRYARLFDLDVTDYASWARGLSECGYATDPNYSSRLITIIERYALYVYDTPEGAEAEETTRFLREQMARHHPVRRSRGLHYVIALPGDTYSSIAKEFKIKKKKLMGYNDAHTDAVRQWEEVYLQEKLDEAPEGKKRATIGADETLHSLSQRYGMRLKRLLELNPGAEDRPGEVIRLR